MGVCLKPAEVRAVDRVVGWHNLVNSSDVPRFSLITSVVASQLSARAMRRRVEMEKLYALSRALILLKPKESIPRQLTDHIGMVFGIPSAVFHTETDQLCAAGAPEIQVGQEQMRECALKNTGSRDPSGNVTVKPLNLAGLSLGSIALPSRSISETAQNAIAGLAAMAFERARIQELAERVEAAKMSERLKSTLVDAIAHEFKTPLTSIKAAVSLLEVDASGTRVELLSIIAEETDYLDGLLAEAIEMGRIEAGMLQLDRQPHSIADVLAAALARVGPALRDRAIRQEVPSSVPDLLVDRDLIGLAIRQLISNAAKYTPPDLPIWIRALARDREVQITIEDCGPGIPEAERARIFDKYYRSSATSTLVPGFGMGLPIAREIVEAHGGSLWVESTAGQGSRFHLTVPCVAPELKT